MAKRPFDAKLFEDLPPLGWLLDLSADRDRPVLCHGRHVDLFEDAFFEGAWDGDFAAAAFDDARNVFGSGARIEPGSVTFVTPSHTLEPLFVFAGDGMTAVSNSLVFLLSYGDLELEPIDWRSGLLFASIVLGLDHAVQTLPLRTGVLSIVYHHNFTVAPGVGLQLVPKEPPPGFADFAAYHRYLSDTVGRVCANAADPARRRRYRPMTTLSSGYDSTACATIAAAFGCGDAISFARSQHGEVDSGVEVAKALGMRLRQFDRPGRATGATFSEAEFVATGMQGEDYTFTAFAELLEGTILFSGHIGDRVWSRSETPNDSLARGDISGCSLGEFRLSRDFLHFPMTFVGARRRTDLHRIANSAEMAPYCVGGPYDRPIARRIAEDAGAPRAAFGQRKRATSLLLYRDGALLSRESLADIEAFRRRLDLDPWSRIRYGLLAARWHAGMTLFHALDRLRRLKGSRFRAVKPVKAIGQAGHSALSRVLGDYRLFEHAHPRNAVWQAWAIARVKARYAAARSKGGGRTA